MPYVLKIVLSAIIIVLVSELGKRAPFIGAIIASLPVVSLLSMIWIYAETRNSQTVATLSTGIFWMVLPSLVLFLALPFLLKKQVPFYSALGLSCMMTVVAYFAMLWLLDKLGIRI